MPESVTTLDEQRVCVIGAGPCGLTAVKNLLQAGCRDVVCYEESGGIGGNWAFTDDPGRAGVHECSHTVSSRRMSSFAGFPMPDDYPDFPSHWQMLAYFTDYARAFRLEPHIRLGSHVQRCTVGVTANGETRAEVFDGLLVCAGHHRVPFVPEYPGRFTGTIMHSSAYKRPDPFRGRRVLVVGAGNSAVDGAVDGARYAARTALSMRAGTYVVPKLVFGKPVDVVHAYWRARVPQPLLGWALRAWLRLAVGTWEDYGLQVPTGAPLEKPPTLNSGVLEALRHGRIVARRGIERCAGNTVHFTDGTREEFDTIIMGTGFAPASRSCPRESPKGPDRDATAALPEDDAPDDSHPVHHRPVPAGRLHLAARRPPGPHRGAADPRAADPPVRHRSAHPPRSRAPASPVRSLAPTRDRSRLSRLPPHTAWRARGSWGVNLYAGSVPAGRRLSA